MLEQLISGESVNVEVGVNDADILKATTYLSVGVFVAVLIAVFIANKIS